MDRRLSPKRSRALVVVAVLVVGLIAYRVVLGPSNCHQGSEVAVSERVGSDGLVSFPTVQAQTLSKRCVIFPDETEGRVGLIFVAFEQGAQRQIDSWVSPLIGDYLDSPDVAYYEIPMISGAYRPVGRLIDSGMRGGVPRNLHDRTATYYGDRGAFFDALKITDKSAAHLFVLDREGRITYRTQGFSTPAEVDEVRSAIVAASA
jgi:ATP10 protein